MIFYLFFATFCRQKVAQKPHGDKFLGATLAVGKTDACALLLREKLSVFYPSVCASPYFQKLADRGLADARWVNTK